MGDDKSANDEPNDEQQADESEEKSFRERVEEIRQERADREPTDSSPNDRMEEMMGGGPGGMGGNPFAQMMGGMMGGGPGPMGGGPGPMGGGPEGGIDTDRLVRELGQLREEVRDVSNQLERIADALESDEQ